MNSPLSSIENRLSRTLEELEQTPVGDRDKRPKIQLCLELRKKDVTKKRATKKSHQLILEVAVWHVKNLPSPPNTPVSTKKQQSQQPQQTFVKIRMNPGDVIHSTEIKLDASKKDKANLNFMEVFEFPLGKVEDLQGRKLDVLVCDRKMTRNCTVFGSAVVECLGEIVVGKPVCRWFGLEGGGGENAVEAGGVKQTVLSF